MKSKLIIAMFLLFCGSLCFTQVSTTVAKKVNSEVEAEVDRTPKKAKTLSLQSGNIIVVADSKEVDKLVKAIQEGQKPKKVAKKSDKHKKDIWQVIGGEVKGFYYKLQKANIITAENLYFLLGGIFVTLIAVVIIKWIIDHIIIKKLASKTKSDFDDKVIKAINPPLNLALYSLGFYLSLMKILVNLDEEVFDWCGKIALALIASAIAWGLYRLVEILTDKMVRYADKTGGRLDDLLINLFRKSLKIALLVVSVLLIGQNILGLNITTLLAGAGIFGLAIAFAAQDTIANFFGSIMIVMDKPFSVGERIQAGDISGVVKSVGFRSTKLETLEGHFISLPNKKITESAIINITKRPFIKFTINLTLVYETTPEQMQEAMDIVRDILRDHEGMDKEKEPKIFFNAFNDWSLNLLVIAWYHPGDWAAANTWMTQVNLQLLKRFNDAGIGFAFPSNTTYLVNGDENVKISVEK